MERRVNLAPRAFALAGVLVLGLALVVAAVLPLGAQTAISADGVLESTTGGFKFPDGTVQTTAVSLGSAPLADTGQQGCWNAAGTSIACSGTGQDGELQRGVAWPAPRFTDNLDGTVTDNLTDLVWLKVANCFGTRTWEQALADANSLMAGQCGLTDGSVGRDWRLPNFKELSSLLDYGESSPALPLGHPFTGVQLFFYWSSSTYVPSEDLAWGLAMGTGMPDAGDKTRSEFLWPVRDAA